MKKVEAKEAQENGKGQGLSDVATILARRVARRPPAFRFQLSNANILWIGPEFSMTLKVTMSLLIREWETLPLEVTEPYLLTLTLRPLILIPMPT